MADRPGLDLELKASTAAFVAQMKAAGNSTRDVARAMRQAFEEVVPGTTRAGEGIGGVEGKLRGFAAEQRGASRMASLLSREFAGLGEVAGLTGQQIHGAAMLFVEGFAGGAGFGLALAGLNLVVEAWKRSAEETKKAKEEATKAAAALEDAAVRYAAAMARAMGGEQAAIMIEHEGEQAKKRRELALATRDLALAQADLNATHFWEVGTGATQRAGRLARVEGLTDTEKRLAIEILAINTDLFNKIEALRQQQFTREAERVNSGIEAEKKAMTAALANAKATFELWTEQDRVIREYRQQRRERESEETLRNAPRPALERPLLQVPMFTPEQKKAYDELAKFTAKMKELELVTSGVGGVFSALGEKFNSSALKMAGQFGELISKAIALAVAVAASEGPFAWMNLPATLAAITAVIASIPKFEAGTPYVPQTGLALLHQGERVVSAAENAAGGGGGGGRPIVVYAMDGPSLRRSLRQNRGELARALAELSDDGRRR